MVKEYEHRARTGVRSRRNPLSIEAAGGEFQDLGYLLLRNVKPLLNLIDGGSGFKIFEDGRYRHPRIAKHPRAAESTRHAFSSGTLGPNESRHRLALLAFYHGLAGTSRSGSGPIALSRPQPGR